MKIEDIIFMPKGEVIGREIVGASFEEWITHVFDHPHADGHWRWNDDFIQWSVPSAKTVEFIAKTFEDCGSLPERFSNHQIANGLEYIGNMALSDISRTLFDESVPWTARKNAIQSLRKLYTELFAPRCSNVLGHLQRSDDQNYDADCDPLNGVCYMWWDVFSVCPNAKNPLHAELDAECLAVMEFAVSLSSDACRESALHGLSHWHFDYPERIRSIIDYFIKTNPGVNPKLIAYARAAREGRIQ